MCIKLFRLWVSPKFDHLDVGPGTVINRPSIKKYQKAIQDRADVRLEGGKIITVEPHPIPKYHIVHRWK